MFHADETWIVRAPAVQLNCRILRSVRPQGALFAFLGELSSSMLEPGPPARIPSGHNGHGANYGHASKFKQNNASYSFSPTFVVMQ